MILSKKLFFLAVSASLSLTAQEWPVKVAVPAVSTDPNQQFGVLYFNAVEKDKFTILYYQPINASVMASKEFIRDTGSVAYTDAKRKDKDIVPYSDQALLLVKQSISSNGTATTEKVWILAKRKFESADDYKLYFKKGFKHPVLKSHTPVTLTVHNLDNVSDLNPAEREALTDLVKREFLPDAPAYVPTPRKNSLGEDMAKMKADFKSLRKTGILFKGDLPKGEDVLTRFSMTKDKALVITKLKVDKKKQILKFYLTADFATFDCIDTNFVEGDVSLTAIQTVETENAEIAGATASFHVKTKDAAGEDVASIYTYLLNQDNEIQHWKHSVGKNKLSSFTPVIAWYRNGDLMTMSTNSEKAFKSYYMVHRFSKGKNAEMLFPLTDEEKGSEKFKFAKTLQPDVKVAMPNGSSMTMAAPPSGVPEKYIPVLFYNINGTQYIIAEGFKRNTTTNTDEYLGLNSYRITEDNKVTNIDALEGYKDAVPVRIDMLGSNKDQICLMAGYLNKLQLLFDKSQLTVTALESETNRLTQVYTGDHTVKTDAGVMLLSKTTMGTKYTVLFYPAK